MKTSFFFAMLLGFVIFLGGCPQNTKKVFSLYKNIPDPKPGCNEYEQLCFRYSINVNNDLNRIILIPYINDVQEKFLPNRQLFDTKIHLDSLLEVFPRGIKDLAVIGVDTIYPGEKRDYFAAITPFDKPENLGAYVFLTFSYYFIEGYEKDPFSKENIQKEYFIIFRDSTDHIRIFEPENGFDPYLHKYHPKPR
jgi:hypothetical protein